MKPLMKSNGGSRGASSAQLDSILGGGWIAVEDRAPEVKPGSFTSAAVEVRAGERIAVAYWHEGEEFPAGDDYVWWPEGFVDADMLDLDFEPTHWRPKG